MMTAARTITNAWINRTLPEIFYEEPEGREEGILQERPIDIIKSSLWERYQDRDDVFISNGVFVSYDITNGNARVLPDLFIAFDVDAAAIRERLPNFWIRETGRVPDFVMEVASPSTAANDLGRKRDLYARLGVSEYWRFDHTGGTSTPSPCRATGWRRVSTFPTTSTRALEDRREPTANSWMLTSIGTAKTLTCWTQPPERRFNRSPQRGRPAGMRRPSGMQPQPGPGRQRLKLTAYERNFVA